MKRVLHFVLRFVPAFAAAALLWAYIKMAFPPGTADDVTARILSSLLPCLLLLCVVLFRRSRWEGQDYLDRTEKYDFREDLRRFVQGDMLWQLAVYALLAVPAALLFSPAGARVAFYIAGFFLFACLNLFTTLLFHKRWRGPEKVKRGIRVKFPEGITPDEKYAFLTKKRKRRVKRIWLIYVSGTVGSIILLIVLICFWPNVLPIYFVLLIIGLAFGRVMAKDRQRETEKALDRMLEKLDTDEEEKITYQKNTSSV